MSAAAAPWSIMSIRRRQCRTAIPRDVVSRLEITRYMRNQLLRDSDVMSMACGIELRVPFLDSELFATMSRDSGVPAACSRASGS